jgi:hypothetical protein
MMNRRDFIKSSALAGGVLTSLQAEAASGSAPADFATTRANPPATASRLPNLSPARWIWYPSGRCLQNTFVLFRRDWRCKAKAKRATGWICADSRYLLELNGKRIQWGPPPADPRWQEADPIDLTDHLAAGHNVFGATVLFYGQGDGTWPIGKPGFLFWLEIEYADGRIEKMVSDASWKTLLCRAWQPGHYKRWYLRALQEEFDARLYPHGWTLAEFAPDQNWLPAMPLGGAPNKPSIATNFSEYQTETGIDPALTELRPRSIPLLKESHVPAKRLAESAWIEWRRPAVEYFECRTPNAFHADRGARFEETAAGCWELDLDEKRGALLTFEFEDQVVGWPQFTIEAPAGTSIELLVHEAHRPGGPVLLNSHYDSWTRFICREGVNRFETFDFESLRWLQLHIHGAAGRAKVSQIGVRRRVFPWPAQAVVRLEEPGLQRLMDASVNTLFNCAQETCVDGMARERQQYSGDGAHQLHAIRLAFGETRLPARFLNTFSQGMTKDGYFLDCWPAYDRLARLMERQLDLTSWGPILDHGIQFNFDCWFHYLHTADQEAVREPYPRLLRFAQYLKSIQGRDGLLPVEKIGIPSVWIDHIAYQQQRHKQCAFNLYAAAAMDQALAPLCRLFGDKRQEKAAREFGRELLAAAVKNFWSGDRGLFVNNLPWRSQEKGPRLCDRSLANALLFNQCPRGRTQPAVEALAHCPPEMGFSYPCNAGWRLWALGRAGRADVIVNDLRGRWAAMDSVRLNNTLQEDWAAAPDSGAQWSHCAVAPLFVFFMSLLGLRPIEPGYRRYELRPQLASLGPFETVMHTMQGPIRFKAVGQLGSRELSISTPPGGLGDLLLPTGESVSLPAAAGPVSADCRRYRLPAGETVLLQLKEV